jgi:hypothetical protein
MNRRAQMQRAAEDTARGVGFSHSPVRETAFVREYDPMTRTHYEVGVFTWAPGTVRIDGDTVDATVERTP